VPQRDPPAVSTDPPGIGDDYPVPQRDLSQPKCCPSRLHYDLLPVISDLELGEDIAERLAVHPTKEQLIASRPDWDRHTVRQDRSTARFTVTCKPCRPSPVDSVWWSMMFQTISWSPPFEQVGEAHRTGRGVEGIISRYQYPGAAAVAPGLPGSWTGEMMSQPWPGASL
jgi:hypothetical protein